MYSTILFLNKMNVMYIMGRKLLKMWRDDFWVIILEIFICTLLHFLNDFCSKHVFLLKSPPLPNPLYFIFAREFSWKN